MNKKQKQKFLILFLILIIFAVDYPFIDKALKNWLSDYEWGFVERVIDGDTFVVNGTSVRLLGINTPEKGEKYSNEAKEFLENLTLNRLVRLEKGKENLDIYGRKLRYVFADGVNINLEVIENGYANFYFPSGKDKYYKTFKQSWENCVSENINLCKKSKDACVDCIFLKDLDVKTQKVVFENKCSYSCDLTNWEVKDEGRKKFIFPEYKLVHEVELIVGNGTNTESKIFWERNEYVWTNSGDTLFLKDAEGGLVLWWSY